MQMKPSKVQNCWKESGIFAEQHWAQIAECNKERGAQAEPEGDEAFDEADFELQTIEEDAAIGVHERRQESVMEVARLVDTFLHHEE